MKKHTPYLLIGLAVLADACQNPVENVELKFKDPMPIAVELHYKTATGTLPTGLQLRLTGPDAANVVTPLNTSKFRLTDNGVLYLSVTPAVTPSATKPLRFSVVATAPGFSDVVQPVQLNGTAARRFSLELLNKQTTTTQLETTAQVTSSGITQAPLAVTVPAPSGQFSLSVPQGTQLKDASGQPVGGALTMQIKPVVATTTAGAAAQLPGNGVIEQPESATGQPAPSQQIKAVAGAVQIEVFNQDYQSVKTFSKPVRLAFALNAQTPNPITGQLVQAGDAIPLFSYDIATQRWQAEPAAQVQRTAQGGLECVADVTHLSWWMAAFTDEVCETAPVFRVTSPIPSGNLTYRCQVIDDATNRVIQNPAGPYEFYSTVNNGDLVRLRNVLSGRNVRLRVYDRESQAVVTSVAINGCSSGEVALDLSVFKRPAVLPVAVKVALKFPCAVLDETKLPTKQIYAQYREAGTKGWHDLPVLRYEAGKTDFSITTYELQAGKTYDFQAGPAPGNFPFSQPGYKLTKPEWIIDVDTKEYCK